MRNLYSKRLKELREEAGLTQQKLAGDLELKRYHISNWEQGRAEPDLDMIIKVALYFKVSSDYLLGMED